MVPYLLFYTKDDTVLNDVPLITNEMYNLTEPVDFVVQDETSNARPEKRTFESAMDDFDEEILWMTFGRIEVSVPFKNLDKFIKTLNEIKKTSKKWGKG